MRKIFQKFWAWYERHYAVNVGLAAFLFALQLFHLYWLTAHVVAHRILGIFLFEPSKLFELIIILVDYTEIPTLIGVSLIYLNNLRKRFDSKSLLYLIFLNLQWLHIFWITDEFVVGRFTETGAGTVFPVWLMWIAILIDYLELPVIYDTARRFIAILKERGPLASLGAFKEKQLL